MKSKERVYMKNKTEQNPKKSHSRSVWGWILLTLITIGYTSAWIVLILPLLSGHESIAVSIGIGTLMFIPLFAIWLVFGIIKMVYSTRKSEKTMESMVLFLTEPSRANVEDARILLQNVMERELAHLDGAFQKIYQVLELHAERADQIEQRLTEHNKQLTTSANVASDRIGDVSRHLSDQLQIFNNLLTSKQWSELKSASENFNSEVKGLFGEAESLADIIVDRTKRIQSQIDSWSESGKNIEQQLNQTSDRTAHQLNSYVIEADTLNEKLGIIMKTTQTEFKEIQSESKKLGAALGENEHLVQAQLEDLKNYTKQSQSLLQSQLNGMINTANAVGTQIRLAESSIEKQEKGLQNAIKELMDYAKNTESYVKNISSEITSLTARLQNEMKDFSNDMVKDLHSVTQVADTTLSQTERATETFSRSVQTMADSVRETLTEITQIHEKLSTQAGGLISMTKETVEQLSPMATIITSYNEALPALTSETRGFIDVFGGQLKAFETEAHGMTDQLAANISALDNKIKGLRESTDSSVESVAGSSHKLELMTEQSRQQMIDLLGDYQKTLDQMNEIHEKMAVLAAKKVMLNIADENDRPTRAPSTTTESFMRSSERIVEKLHAMSIDLTKLTGAAIPDTVWDRYNAGDKTIFSKWFSKMIKSADKKKVQELFKSDAAFRSHATTFIKGFQRMMNDAESTDNPEILTQTLLKTDLGQMYMALRAYL